ncbi:MAG: hypothetical protein V4850_07505 [Myxococcota bacterium]
MTLLLLVACTEPSTLETVSAALADRAVADAEAPLRTMTAVAGLLAETCGVASVEDYVFVSRSAVAFGVSVATVEREETTQTWTFAEVGIDGTLGTLQVATDASQDNLAVTYTAEGLKLTAGIELRDCDADVPSAVMGGTGTWATAQLSTALTLVGAAPANGLAFDPVTADVPTAGQVRAADEAADWIILLDDAATLPPEAGKWTGQASGTGWAHTIEVGWP